MKPIFEKVPRTLTECFYCERVTSRTVPTPWHFHPEHQITLVLDGVGHRMVGDHLAGFSPGDLVFVGANLPHVWHYDRPRPGRAPVDFSVVIQFLEDFLGAGFLALPEAAGVRRLLRRGVVGLRVQGRTRAEVAPLVERVAGARGLRRITLLLEVLERLSLSRELVPLSSPGFQPKLNPFDQERVGMVCDFVNANLYSPIFREELSRLLHMSPDGFGRFFRSHTGRTLPRFVNELRLSRACRLLAEGEQSVTEIAGACGFENLSNFNRQFRRQFGRTPREYRAAFRTTGAIDGTA